MHNCELLVRIAISRSKILKSMYTYLYMVKMVSKNISVTKGAYDLLSNMKLEGESFSDVITRLAKAKGGLSECAGLWGDMSVEELEEVKAGIEGMRRSVDERLRGVAIT